MTICVTPEEVSDYQTAVRNWSDARIAKVEKLIHDHLGIGDGGMTTMLRLSKQQFAEKIRQWEAEHPFPRLVPPV